MRTWWAQRQLLKWNGGRCNSGEGWTFITMGWELRRWRKASCVFRGLNQGLLLFMFCHLKVNIKELSHTLGYLTIPSPPRSKFCKYFYSLKQGCKQVSKIPKFQKGYLLDTNRIEIRYQIRRKRKFYMVGWCISQEGRLLNLTSLFKGF